MAVGSRCRARHRARARARARGGPAAHGGERARVRGSQPTSRSARFSAAGTSGAGYKRLFGSDVAFRDDGVLELRTGPDVGARPSYAIGGLSNVWGSGVLPYADRDLDGWPIERGRARRRLPRGARFHSLRGRGRRARGALSARDRARRAAARARRPARRCSRGCAATPRRARRRGLSLRCRRVSRSVSGTRPVGRAACTAGTASTDAPTGTSTTRRTRSMSCAATG